jgi:hypothetical protein
MGDFQQNDSWVELEIDLPRKHKIKTDERMSVLSAVEFTQ